MLTSGEPSLGDQGLHLQWRVLGEDSKEVLALPPSTGQKKVWTRAAVGRSTPLTASIACQAQ